MSDDLALVRLPDIAVAPGYRDALSQRSHFVVEDFGAGIVGVAPAEGARAIASHFSLIQICTPTSDLDDPDLWTALVEHAPRVRGDVDPDAYLAAMLERAQTLTSGREDTEAQIVGMALQAFGAAQAGQLPELLRVNLPPLFERFPRGSLWLVATSDELLARLAFGRAQLGFQLTPDLPLGPEMDALRSFSGLTLSEGINFGAVMNVPLLIRSPAVLGFQIPALPHTLIFCFGEDVDLRRPYPTSFSSLFRPAVLGDAEGLDRSSILEGARADDAPRLLEWWVDRLNHLYSYATDPTRFTQAATGAAGYHDAAAQSAWMITMERLMGDIVTLLAEPQATDLDRVQMAFDLLDKAEGLLDYGYKQTGKGFASFLMRRKCAPRLRDAFSSMPDDLALRISDEVDRLFAGLYSEIRDNTLSHRLTAGGARISTTDPTNLKAVSDDELVSSLCRAVRNSSHGLLEILRSHED